MRIRADALCEQMATAGRESVLEGEIARAVQNSVIFASEPDDTLEAASSGQRRQLPRGNQGVALEPVIVDPVRHGWVELEKYGLQSLIPEGAQAEFDSKSGPGTPFDDHATAQFRAALKAIDALGRSVPDNDPAIEQLAEASSATDAITLISLLTRYPQLADTPIYDRAIALLPPPDGLTRDAVRYKNQVLMDDWWHKLPYSRVKSWWLRWPDLLQDETP
jgi:hypothetical protein